VPTYALDLLATGVHERCIARHAWHGLREDLGAGAPLDLSCHHWQAVLAFGSLPTLPHFRARKMINTGTLDITGARGAGKDGATGQRPGTLRCDAIRIQIIKLSTVSVLLCLSALLAAGGAQLTSCSCRHA
jgi:hypothetical protein